MSFMRKKHVRQDEDILAVTSGDDVAMAASELFGGLGELKGVVHVTAVWAAGAGSLVTLAINEDTPRCHHDFFSLNMVRASADAIVTTGKILRTEPHLEHRLAGPGEHSRALMDYRQRLLGKERPPVTLVLTSGRGLDLEHSVLHSWTRPLVYTSREGQWELESRAADCGVEVVGVSEPSISHAIELLRHEFGAATIAIEAGPSVSSHLYDPVAVDHLLLSTYQAPRLAAKAEGGMFLEEGKLNEIFSTVSPASSASTDDGIWEFRHFRR